MKDLEELYHKLDDLAEAARKAGDDRDMDHLIDARNSIGGIVRDHDWWAGKHLHDSRVCRGPYPQPSTTNP